MSETATDTPSNPRPGDALPSDRQVLDQVEKWMAIIREISQEPRQASRTEEALQLTN
jgi:hypothetical protein